jgi:FkbM family methyltransferase
VDLHGAETLKEFHTRLAELIAVLKKTDRSYDEAVPVSRNLAMKASRRRLEELAWCFGVPRAADRLYSLVKPRDKRLRARLIEFFRGLVPPDALVFDIGTNVGTYASALEELGARVIAVDANADSLRHIELTYPGKRIESLHAAVGNQRGLVSFNICDSDDGTSAISSPWLESLNERYGRTAQKWNRRVSVPMITLDDLVAHFGQPYYIKIDIEGSDGMALDGLTAQPPLVSFEFHRFCLRDAFTSIEKVVFDAGSRFNLALSPTEFLLPERVDREQIKSAIEGVEDLNTWGDIFVWKPRERQSPLG